MTQFAISTLLVLGVAAVAVYFCLRAFLRWRASRNRLISLVWLLGTPRTLSEASVRRIASEALGIAFDPHDPDASEFVVSASTPPVESVPRGAARSYIVRVSSGAFVVNNLAVPYMDEPEVFAETIADKRLGEAFAQHRAWLSVDALEPVRDDQKKLAAYRTIGKLMALLSGSDCLAIYCPELERCNVFDKTVVETLRSEEPLTLFEAPTFAPIVGIDGDDPRMAEAVAEARRRWPEFVAQFNARGDEGHPFLIKAEFQDGDKSEFMWVSVNRITDEEVHGVLENSPHELTNVREGERVSVPLSALNDWAYANGDDSVGGFTVKAIQEIYEGK